ncbi:MAG TPA: hypothetical protein VF066_05920 [Thermoleophilaceae bacterium]
MSGAQLIGGLTWEQLSRGRKPRRLRRGRDFEGDVRALARMARDAASAGGWAVRTVREDFRKNAYLWVQFADHEIALGQPCPACGGRDLIRTHAQFGRCRQCGAYLIFTAPEPTIGGAEAIDDGASPQVEGLSEPARGKRTAQLEAAKEQRKLVRARSRRLDEFDDLRLVRDDDESDETQEVWYGTATHDGEPVLLRIIFPLDEDGTRQEHPDQAGEDLRYIHVFPRDPFEHATRLGLIATSGSS